MTARTGPFSMFIPDNAINILEADEDRLKRGRSLECCDLLQLSNVAWLSTKNGVRAPHPKERPQETAPRVIGCRDPPTDFEGSKFRSKIAPKLRISF
jgi:hypothetical protein